MDAGSIALLVAAISGPFGGALAAKYIRPQATIAERLAVLEGDFRVLQDYTHLLRQHIADGNPPPPPPWPEGLSR